MGNTRENRGYEVYTGWSDRYYNFWTYNINCPFAWGVRLKQLVSFNLEHMTKNHLEVGVATSKIIEKCATKGQMLGLLDMNTFSLDKTSEKLRGKYQIRPIQANILDPIAETHQYTSIALNFVMHCVAGSFEEGEKTKRQAFYHLGKLLTEEGVLYGTTILAQGVKHNIFGRYLCWQFNSLGMFSNTQDSAHDLKAGLEQYFDDVSVEMKKRVAFFVARRFKTRQC